MSKRKWCGVDIFVTIFDILFSNHDIYVTHFWTY
jgi:hypothetical protein